MMQWIVLFFCWCSTAFAAPQFLTITDIHYGSANVAKDGQDTGDEFLAITMQQLAKLSSQVDFILNLGDLPTHSLFTTAKKEQYEQAVFHSLFVADSAAKPMFYISGNNDSLAGNYQPFALNGKSPLDFANEWTGACAYCDGLIIDDTHMQQGGYYSSYVIPGNKDIVLIALNTTPWSESQFWLPAYPNQEQDAQEEFAWLEHQLKQHQTRQLLIAMHIPPGNVYTGKGNTFWKPQYNQQFLKMMQDHYHFYHEITLLTAHTHTDEIRKIELHGLGSIYAYATPGISRNHHNNPGMKVFTLNEQLELSNYTTYYTSSLVSWGNESYQAAGATDAIFPHCENKSLSQCLDSLSGEQVCHYLEDGLYYGVKSSRIIQNVCNITYPVT